MKRSNELTPTQQLGYAIEAHELLMKIRASGQVDNNRASQTKDASNRALVVIATYANPIAEQTGLVRIHSFKKA